ncbi:MULTISPECIES: ATP-binding protein [unclassified Imperialibacter]|uniref:sensor histidine kinase n=1 Tax=unclassified Imperialibacter TaxID=2629706 RepID=UPI001253B508|nr:MULTISPECIES: PAS domain-containing sensor histidine kinase [unclassified Imperialibacter]CAD5248410.1 putative Histidine kinase [Imperialibacter sp. 75]CAD5248573.1 putative Histidine kinase [Imperialibacter sp. 89]VVS97758.1 putative Histidine kinase [Imperialibacter sp. EC-SDR9]
MKLTSFRIVMVYFLIATMYIVLSDKIVSYLVRDINLLSEIQSYKGLFFVASTSVLLYYLIKINTRELRKEKTEALRNEQKYRLLFNQNPLPMWVYDAGTHRILDVNETSVSIYGYSRAEFLTMILEDIQLEAQPGDVSPKPAEQGDFFRLTGRRKHLKKNGASIFVEIFTHAVDYKGVSANMVLVHDISDMLKSQEDLTSSVNELNNFVYRASHDLRGPIARMIGLSELGKTVHDVSDSMEYFGLIGQTAYKLDKSLQRLLIINSIKGRELEAKERSLHSMINESVKAFSFDLADQNVALTLTEGPDTTVCCDKYFFRVALDSLIENSINFRAPARVRKATIVIDYVRTETHLQVRVTDNGIGVKKEVKDHIFTLFYRGAEESKGSGLGLYLASSALARVGGSLALQSSDEESTTFIISIPLAWSPQLL